MLRCVTAGQLLLLKGLIEHNYLVLRCVPAGQLLLLKLLIKHDYLVLRCVSAGQLLFLEEGWINKLGMLCLVLRCVTAGQLLRHYSPDLEVIRVVGATPANTKGRVRHAGGHADLVDMARWGGNRSPSN